MKEFKKIVSALLLVVMVICLNVNNGMQEVSAAVEDYSITGNDTKSQAYNYGRWQSINSVSKTGVLEKEQEQAWFQFSLAPNEHIYIRCSSGEEYVGMNAFIQDALGNQITPTKKNPANLMGKKYMTALYLDCDNTSSQTRNYYLVVDRGNYDSSKGIYFGLTSYNRIKDGRGTFSFTGTATNSGNTKINFDGVDSTQLRLDLTNNTKIPENAIVKRVSTAGKQSPSQGNVHHMIMPKMEGSWYTSRVASDNSGMYLIDASDKIEAKQLWFFKYNAKATAKSTMSNVTLSLEWQYDLKYTNYETIIN